MSLRARDEHRAHSVAAGIATLGLSGLWLTLALDGTTIAVTLIVMALVAACILSCGVRWLSLPRMLRPVYRAPSGKLRIAAVTTFVPSHEPLDMLERSLVAMLGMQEPHHTWVLDESNSDAVRALCDRLGVRHFSRAGEPRYNQLSGAFRSNTKHGNYNSWCERNGFNDYDVLAMFDPDHIPDVTYLHRTLGYLSDPRVAFVQPPQVYYNQAASFVARGAAEESYSYYSTHLMASYALGHTIVIGSHGVHRLAALQDVGGFPAHDAEDLYLTMLYRAAGWRGVFVPEVLAMGLTPMNWSSYLQQQQRWARSLLDLKFRVLPALAPRLSPRERVANLVHGVWYLRALALPVLYAMLCGLLVTNTVPAFLRRDAVLALAALAVVPLTLGMVQHRYYLAPDRLDRFHWRGLVMQFAKWPALIRATAQAITGRSHTYALTSKRAGVAPSTVLAPAHVMVVVIIATAWAVGIGRHGSLHPHLTIAAAMVTAISLALAGSDLFSGVSTFTANLYETRRTAAHRSPRWMGGHEAA